MDLLNEFITKGDNKVLENLNKNIFNLNKNNKEYWNFMIINSNLSNDTILENIENIDLKLLIKNHKINSELLNNESFSKLIINNNLLNLLICNQIMNMQFINKMIELNLNFDWDLLCKYQNLDLNFLEKNIKNINLDIISETQFITIEFINKYKDILNWDNLGKNIKIQYLINDNFVNIFGEYCNNNSIIWSNNISNKYLNENLNKLTNEQILDLLEIRKLEKDTINFIINNYKIDGLFKSICEGQDLSIEFIENNLLNLGIDNVILEQDIDINFILKYQGIISLKKLSYNDYLNQDLILEIYPHMKNFKDEFDWEFIIEHIEWDKDKIKHIKEIDKNLIVKKFLNI